MTTHSTSNSILKIGHRGAKGHIAENTLESIQKALNLGVEAIEIDVHLCKSGELVVFHDFTLDRLTNGSGEIIEFTLAELKKLNVNEVYSIPTLTEVFNLINNTCLLNIELKGNNTVEAVANSIENQVNTTPWDYSNIIVSSFQHDLLRGVYKLNKKIPLGILTDISLAEALQTAKELKAVAIHPDYTMLTKRNVSEMQEKGYKVYPWTVNEPNTIARIKSYNVDGIISDYPERI